MPTGDIVITLALLEEFTHVPCNAYHRDPLPLIDYMIVMEAAVQNKIGGLKPVLHSETYITLVARFNAIY